MASEALFVAGSLRPIHFVQQTLCRLQPSSVVHDIKTALESFGNNTHGNGTALGNDLGLGALDDGYDGALAAMSGLVGEYRVDVIAYRRLVYRVVLAEVLRQQHPVCSMFLLVPLLEITQALLIVAFQSAALDVKETGYGGTRDGEIIQDRL